jgi:hypothetical protein
MSKIKGSYYLKSTQMQKSKVAHQPPHYREIWDLLIRDSTHNGKRERGLIIERGQCVKSYKDIQNDLHWKVGYRKHVYPINSVKNAIRWLKNKRMIKTMATSTVTHHAMLITVIKLNKYQNPANYEYTHDYSIDNKPENNMSTDKKTENALIIYDYYIKKIQPYHKSKQRALNNIRRYLKKYTPKNLAITVSNYAIIVNTENREAEHRKDPANFFGIREKFFVDYLPGNFKMPELNKQTIYPELDITKIYDNPKSTTPP